MSQIGAPAKMWCAEARYCSDKKIVDRNLNSIRNREASYLHTMTGVIMAVASRSRAFGQWIGMLVIISIVAGCGPSHDEIVNMTPGKVSPAVADSRLCWAYAWEVKEGRRPTALIRELERRRVDCGRDVTRLTPDCSKVQVVRTSRDPQYANVWYAEIRNSNSFPMSFNLHMDSMVSYNNRIEANSTETFSFAADRGTMMAGALLGAARGRSSQPARVDQCTGTK